MFRCCADYVELELGRARGACLGDRLRRYGTGSSKPPLKENEATGEQGTGFVRWRERGRVRGRSVRVMEVVCECVRASVCECEVR